MAEAAKNSIEGKSEPYLKRIESLYRDLATLRSDYMNECKPIHEDIKDLYTEAKDAGVPVKALRSLVKYRELERRQQALGEGLDIDEGAAFEVLIEALGPLGAAAANKAGFGKGPAPTPAEKDAEAAKAAGETEARLAKLGRGREAKAAAVDSLTDPPQAA